MQRRNLLTAPVHANAARRWTALWISLASPTLWLVASPAYAWQIDCAHVRGNPWWIEFNVAYYTGGELASCFAHVDGMGDIPMEATAWGSWAVSPELAVNNGTAVTFWCTSTSGVYATCGSFSWPDRARLSGGSPSPPRDAPNDCFADFTHARGNRWWLEANLVAHSSAPYGEVQFNIDGGRWYAAEPTEWGSYGLADSGAAEADGIFPVPYGSAVGMRVRCTSGGASTPVLFVWPTLERINSVPLDNPRQSDGAGTSAVDARYCGGCGAGEQCCQVSHTNILPLEEREFACFRPTADGSCPGPDLIVDRATLLTSITGPEQVVYAPDDCAVVEGCIAPGERTIVRFSTLTSNYGEHDVVIGAPEEPLFAPLFEHNLCHAHHHLLGYVLYRLYDRHGNQVADGVKESFCMRDTFSVREDAGPSSGFACETAGAVQGITAGWGDRYDRSLDCQWIDVTDLPPGEYTLRVEVNFDRMLYETDYGNNVTEIPLVLR